MVADVHLAVAASVSASWVASKLTPHLLHSTPLYTMLTDSHYILVPDFSLLIYVAREIALLISTNVVTEKRPANDFFK